MRANQEITERKRRSREEIKRLVSEFEASGARPAESWRTRQLKRRRLGNRKARARRERRRTASNPLVAVEVGQEGPGWVSLAGVCLKNPARKRGSFCHSRWERCPGVRRGVIV